MMWTAGKHLSDGTKLIKAGDNVPDSDGTNIPSTHSNNIQKRIAPQIVAVINT